MNKYYINNYAILNYSPFKENKFYKNSFIYDYKFKYIKSINIFYILNKYYIFNNSFIYFCKNNFFLNFWSNTIFNYNYIFNCCFYNFYLENIFLFFKINDINKNQFYLFFVKFFKKKKKKKSKFFPKKKKKKFFKFRKKRFKFKKLRKYFKKFKFKKGKSKNEKILDLNFIYYYNYLAKINSSKKIKKKLINLDFYYFYFIENNCVSFLLNYQYFSKKEFFFLTFFPIKNYLNFNVFFLRLLRRKYTFKYVENLSFLKRVGFKTKIIFFKKFIKINFINVNFKNYNLYLKNSIKIFLNLIFCFYNLNLSKFFINLFIFKNKYLNIKKRKVFRRKKRFFLFKTKFFKKKKKYRYKTRYIFFNKLNIKKNVILLKKFFFKLVIVNLINNFRINFSFFYFNALNKYSFFLYFFLKNQKTHMNYFFKKNLFFFNLLKKKNNNLNVLYNNQFPIYTSNKILLKSFRKIFKSFFNKKSNNYLYYYIIPFFEFFLNKNVFIKTTNSNIFKKIKFKKKLILKKLIKIHRKNKLSVLSRSITFNLYEFIEIIIYSFYYKDASLLSNWFLKNFRDIHFTNHKNFLVFFKTVINDIFESYRDIFKVKGFYFILKGKIGVTSNAKKKTVKFIIGSSNKSKKIQKMDFQQGVVKSLSGSLGVSMILTY